MAVMDCALDTEMPAGQAWHDKPAFDHAEDMFFSNAKVTAAPASTADSSLAQQISKIRSNIRDACDRTPTSESSKQTPSADLENENKYLKSAVSKLESALSALTLRLGSVEAQLASLTIKCGGAPCAAPAAPCAAKTPAKVVEEEDDDDDDDDDVDLFGSDDEEENAEAARVREERLKAYAEKKSKKAGPIAKSSVLLDVKPWADDTDLKAMEECIRGIDMDGLVWGAAKAVPLAFGVHKLSILMTIEDEKISVDDISEKIESFEEYVQSVDIQAFNKV